MSIAPPTTGRTRTYEVRMYGCQMNVHDSGRLSACSEIHVDYYHRSSLMPSIREDWRGLGRIEKAVISGLLLLAVIFFFLGLAERL